MSSDVALANSISKRAYLNMSRRLVPLFSGLFVLAQLAIASVGVWADAKQELAVFAAEIHVESQTDSCVQAHDHRLCVVCRSATGLAASTVSLPVQPAITSVATSAASASVVDRAFTCALPPTRGPPLFT